MDNLQRLIVALDDGEEVRIEKREGFVHLRVVVVKEGRRYSFDKVISQEILSSSSFDIVSYELDRLIIEVIKAKK